MTGTVKTLRDAFGFIAGSDGKDYFFIPSGLQRTCPLSFDELAEDMQVEAFTPIMHPRGPRAIEIMIRESVGGDNNQGKSRTRNIEVAGPPIGWRD